MNESDHQVELGSSHYLGILKMVIMFAFNNADLPCLKKDKHIKVSSLLKMIKNVISVDLQSSYIYHVSMETNSGTYDFY